MIRSEFFATRLAALVLLTLGAPQAADGRITKHLTDQKIFEKADLIVVARVLSTKDTEERTTLPDLRPDFKVIGVETTFEACLILKGPKTTMNFRVHHYKAIEQFSNGPWLIEISPNQHPTYLLFLIKEKDGRYAPTDQVDPVGWAAWHLVGATGPRQPDPAVRCQKKDPPGSSRHDEGTTYEQMFDKADLVVTANWVSKQDTDEHGTLEPDLPVIGVTTGFETSLTFKGAKDIKNIVLHHYKFEFEDDAFREGAPQVVRIVPPVNRSSGTYYPGGGRFLLFLKKETDGRYAPVTGQTNPGLSSVLMMTTSP